MDLCQETSCFRLASGKKQIIYILTEHIGDNFGRYPKILNAIFANLTVEIRISIEKDKSEPVSNREKVRIIFACPMCIKKIFFGGFASGT